MLRGEKNERRKEVSDDTLYVVNPVIMCLKFCTIKAKQNCWHEVFIEQKNKKDKDKLL